MLLGGRLAGEPTSSLLALTSISIALLLAGASQSPQLNTQAVEAALSWSSRQLLTALSARPISSQPSRVDLNSSHGVWLWCDVYYWTSGFFSGCLWEMDQIAHLLQSTGGGLSSLTLGSPWSTLATATMQDLAPNAYMKNTADVGFIMQTSFGESLAVMGSLDTTSPKLLLQAAGSESSRFVPAAGVIRSWDNIAGQPPFWVQVIIDNMMNLELMMSSSNLPGGNNTQWRTQATSHAQRTALNHVRSDGSTYHRVIYSSLTGAVLEQGTVQGYANWSCWSRGQAWAVAGFTMMYRETQIPLFLDTAISVANYFVTNLPADSVPLWDFQAPPSLPYKDTSAASAAASGLAELETYAPGLGYMSAAVTILNSLSKSYLSSASSQPSMSILLNGSSYVMAGGFDQGLIYGDYYYLKALRMVVQQQGGLANATSLPPPQQPPTWKPPPRFPPPPKPPSY